MSNSIHLVIAIFVAVATFVVRRVDRCVLAFQMAYVSLGRRSTNRNTMHTVPNGPVWSTGERC